MGKQCEHKTTRKLFWMDSRATKRTWKRTDIHFCIDCNKVVQMEELK